ncbi:DUF397 domain-containing protein [Streptomyces sp. NPDC127098]|uniref:DUF397 domain-containing protein n=1 Tax=Streptomyces sp. NPDC127098 TaxID=3347137 RepID=UPI003661B167
MRSPRIDVSHAAWRRSSYSNQDGGNCVEVADGFPGVLPIRDSKRPDGPVLVVDGAAVAPNRPAPAGSTPP